MIDLARKYTFRKSTAKSVLPKNPLPMALDLEESVLGACLLSKDLLFEYLENLHEGLFAHAPHELIRQAICSLAKEGTPVDYRIVVHRLRKMGCLEEVGGTSLLSPSNR